METSDRQQPQKLYAGLDVGTSGVRALAVTASGEVAAGAEVELQAEAAPAGDTRHEQDPHAWRAAADKVLGQLVSRLRDAGISPEAIEAVAVDGTSGTIVALDEDGEPVRAALMYNDLRAQEEAVQLCDDAAEYCRRHGTEITPSYAIAKIRWLERHEPQKFGQTELFAHQADYLAGYLSGRRGVTDYSNALKSGYDLIDERWPDWLERHAEIRRRLPRVVAPGTPLGTIAPRVAARLGLSRETVVVSGATDGTAGFLASGARQLGEGNTTLGTTLVFKILSDRICTHPDGLIYSHKLPGGYWLPGAASSTGGQWIAKRFPGADLAELDRQAADRLPNDHVAYPLAGRGERFPLRAPDLEGFVEPPTDDRLEKYAACLQGTAFVERLCYETLDEATAGCGADIYATGGGSLSDVWMQLRADVTGRRFHRPACPQAAFGSAVLAAAGKQQQDLWTCIRQMVRLDRSFKPNQARREAYDAHYQRFKHLVQLRLADQNP